MKIIDLHNDYLTELNNREIIKYLKNNECYLHSLFSPIWTTELKNPLTLIKNKDKLIKNDKFNKKTHICIEDMHFFEENMKEDILSINPFYCGLCWNYENNFCGGAYSNANLSLKGKKLIKFLETNNIIVDCAHMNQKSFYQFANITTKPLFCSHTGFKSIICDDRNLSDEQIKQIVKSNGLIGFYFVGKYISNNKVTINDIVKNIKHFVNLYGCDNLAIGSDFYGTKDLPKNLKNYKDFENLKNLLLKHGFNNHEIKKLFFENAKNFIKKRD